MTVEYWHVPPLWRGETAFVLAGGPSLAHADLELLRGRHVVAINSSAFTWPEAEFLFSSDGRWLRRNRRRLEALAPRVIAGVSKVTWPGLRHLRRQAPPGLARARDAVVFRHTSLASAINFAGHLIERGTIVLLGADGKAEPVTDSAGRPVTDATTGRPCLRTHHHAPHPWAQVEGCWELHREDLETLVEPLRRSGIRVLNASPGSAWADLWPVMRLDEALAIVDATEAAPC